MYHSFSIKNFRCFDDLTLEGLGRINLIGGRNNIGKTAVLEAFWIHNGPTDRERVLWLDTRRGLFDPESTVKNLFYGFDSSTVIELCAWGVWGPSPRHLTIYAEENPWIAVPGNSSIGIPSVVSQNRIVLDYLDETGVRAETKVWLDWLDKHGDNPGGLKPDSFRNWPEALSLPPSGVFIHANGLDDRIANVGRHSRLEIDGRQDGVLQILQIVEPKLQRLAILATGTEARLYADVGTKPLIPVQLMGAGMSRILSLALAIASSPGGMVMVDEIENGLHYTVMEKVWQAIAAFARHYDVQIFATTHSHHCIQSACRAFAADEEEPLQLYSLAVRKGKMSAVRNDRERLEFAFEVGLGVI